MALFNRGFSSPDDLIFAKAECDDLSAAASERIARMRTYREEGNRVRDPNLYSPPSQTEDYGHRRKQPAVRQRHKLTLPLGKAMTVKHAYRIAGQLPDVVVDRRDESEQERYRSDSMEKLVWSILRASHGPTTLSSGSWNASELGSAVFGMYLDINKQIPIVHSCDPTGFLEVRGVDDPHDFQRIYRVWEAPVNSVRAEYRDAQFRGAPVPVEDISANAHLAGQDVVRIVQLCDREKVVRWADCGGHVVGLYEFVHNYGFVPYIVIPNLGPYEDVWGWADYEFVRVLTDYMQLLLSREADVLRSVASGAYQEIGTGKSAAEIAEIIARGGVASVKRDSEIKPIEAAEMPAFADSHRQTVMELTKMLGFAPDAAWGLPGSGSGTDRGLQLQPLLEYTAMKQLNWQQGLSRLFGMAFQMIEQKMVKATKYRGSKPGKAGRQLPFILELGPDLAPIESAPNLQTGETVKLPRTPKELFDGDYEVRFVWRNRIDPEDPQYVMSELNKFQAGAQSLETTLENLGVQAPQDEMRRIEREAEQFPWVNQGLVSLLLGQFRGNQQGQGGGASFDRSGAIAGAMETMSGLGGGGQSGALNIDAGTSALGPDSVGTPYGGA